MPDAQVYGDCLKVLMALNDAVQLGSRCMSDSVSRRLKVLIYEHVGVRSTVSACLFHHEGTFTQREHQLLFKKGGCDVQVPVHNNRHQGMQL